MDVRTDGQVGGQMDGRRMGGWRARGQLEGKEAEEETPRLEGEGMMQSREGQRSAWGGQ